MRIAVVDDDREMLAFVQDSLRSYGHSCEGYASGSNLLAALRRDTFDLLLLDWYLPDMSGFDLLNQIRATDGSGMGIIMLTNRSEKDVIAEALSAGADDYIIKPESASVIAARIDAVLRRSHHAPHKDEDQRFARFGDYLFDRLSKTIHIQDEPVPLNSKEFALALLLFENINRPLSRGYILESLWHADPNLHTRTLDMHISRIRTKLHLRPENGFRIAAVSGYGYRMERYGEGEAL